MKKLGIGCLIVVVVLGIGAAVAGYVVYDRIYKPAAEYVGSFKQLSTVAELERRVKNTAPFSAPAGGELNEELVGRFIKVQDELQSRLGGRLQELKTKYGQIDRAMKTGDRNASFPEAMRALKDLTAVLVEAKQAQVEALNAAGFSVKEYEWVRNQAYAALGILAASFDVKDIAKIVQERGVAAETEIGEVPDRNRQLVAPYEKKLREWAALAYFGL